ncbi:hypothetical protein G7Z17_g4041 [Cylindrodendrum hubeiense]|uniref:BZIP domain-containing protein n=1 Tax=Cylindrodendrum hubeiense TaxID=595255 RepID=A0A9P5LA99_9HYPO|nr:hypothetical protein G7Z17_g4041 [Cylindrodendrum hubeiense]
MDSASTNDRLPSTRARKRKPSGRVAAAAEEDKKRAQNRVAQKSFREKQQSRLQYLESFVEAIKSGQVTQNEDARYDKLLRSHLELLDENRRLKDNLIGLRQKLTYIGQSASAAAEDGLFDSLLKDHGSEHGSASSPQANQLQLESLTARAVAQNKQQSILTTSPPSDTYGPVLASNIERNAPEPRGKEPVWRLCNTTEFRIAIPEPFRPTPLQDASAFYPIIIDFITWPSIRDQMILHRDSLDLDLLCQELTLHAVIEIPEKEVAIGVYDYVQNAMFMQERQAAADGTSTCLEDLDWTYLHVPLDLACSMGFDPAEDLIVHELANRVRNTNLGQSQSSLSEPSNPVSKIGEEKHEQLKQRGISHPGIHHMRTWRLSKEFAWKWPLLDCSSVISAYDKVSYTTVSQVIS